MTAVISPQLAIRAECMYLEVRPSNAGALALYRRPGYHPVADGREDAAVMVHHLHDDG